MRGTVVIISKGTRKYLYSDTIGKLVRELDRTKFKLVCWVNGEGSWFRKKDFDFLWCSKFNTFKLPLNYLVREQAEGEVLVYLDDDIYFEDLKFLYDSVEVFKTLNRGHSVSVLSRLVWDGVRDERKNKEWERLPAKVKIKKTKWRHAKDVDPGFNSWTPVKDGRFAFLRGNPNTYYWLGGFLIFDLEKVKNLPFGYIFPFGTDTIGQGYFFDHLGLKRASFFSESPIYHLGATSVDLFAKEHGAETVRLVRNKAREITELRVKWIKRAL